MKKFFTISLSFLMLCAAPVSARVALAERVASSYISPVAGCMTENAQISINFNGAEPDASIVKTKFDAKMVEIEKLLKEAALEKFEMQSMNYNISPQNYGGSSTMVHYNGSLNYTVIPSSKATMLMAVLTKKGYQTSVNVNAYRNGGVPCPVAETGKKQ